MHRVVVIRRGRMSDPGLELVLCVCAALLLFRVACLLVMLADVAHSIQKPCGESSGPGWLLYLLLLGGGGGVGALDPGPWTPELRSPGPWTLDPGS